MARQDDARFPRNVMSENLVCSVEIPSINLASKSASKVEMVLELLSCILPWYCAFSMMVL